MNGPSEFHVTGVIKEWNIQDRLTEIDLPTLVVGGRHDEMTPLITEAVGIRNSEWVVFENSAHMPYLEETARVIEILGDFLDGAEANNRR